MTRHSKAVELAQALRDFGFQDTRADYRNTFGAHRRGTPWEVIQKRIEEGNKSRRGFFTRYSDPRVGGRTRHKFELQSEHPEVLKSFMEIVGDVVPGALVTFEHHKRSATITWTE